MSRQQREALDRFYRTSEMSGSTSSSVGSCPSTRALVNPQPPHSAICCLVG